VTHIEQAPPIDEGYSGRFCPAKLGTGSFENDAILASFLGDRQFLAGMPLIVKSTSPKARVCEIGFESNSGAIL
jgi:hypothetical protein